MSDTPTPTTERTEESARSATIAQNQAVHVRSVPLGGSKLSRALQESDGLHDWLAPRPRSSEAWRARADDVRQQGTSSDWFERLAPAFAATGEAHARLSRAATNGIVVTTGQQPGLFGGPTYTWTKAVAARALADALEASLGIPVAPVFWAATDDADWMEAAVTHFLTPTGLESASMVGPATSGVAMSDVALGDLDAAFRALYSASGSSANAAALEEVRRAYVPHATVGAAYLQLLRALLEPLGIAVLDASHVATRTAADPFLRRALTRAAAVSERLATRVAAIVDAGFRPQVEAIDSLSLVFQTRLGASGRTSERTRERVPVADAARVAREADVGTLGSNVLLRPVLERCLLPTIAYVAGPGEYAYFAQIAPIAHALNYSVPLPIPRWAGEVIEARSVALLQQLGIQEPQLDDPHAVEGELARAALPDDVQDALERLRMTTDTQTRAVRSAIAAADGLVDASVVDGLQRDVTHRMERFERRLVAGAKRRETQLMRDIAVVRAAFRPMGASPERVLNLLPALARYGSHVFDLMLVQARAYADAIVDSGPPPVAPHHL